MDQIARDHRRAMECAVFFGIFHPVEEPVKSLVWRVRLACRLASWWAMLNEPVVIHLGECREWDD